MGRSPSWRYSRHRHRKRSSSLRNERYHSHRNRYRSYSSHNKSSRLRHKHRHRGYDDSYSPRHSRRRRTRDEISSRSYSSDRRGRHGYDRKDSSRRYSRPDKRAKRQYSDRHGTDSKRHRHSRTRATKSSKREKSPHDKIVHFAWTKGMDIGGYTALSRISDGTFGRVLLCKKDDHEFAVKVVRNVEKYTSSAKIEADILENIQTMDPSGESHCVVLKDKFMYKNRHMCLVFENLGPSLYEFLEDNDFKGFFIADIQKIAYQVLKGLAYLRKCNIIHTDLKPENILLTCAADQYIEVLFPRSTTGMTTKRPITADVKIIDFGSAIYNDEYHSSIINTRQYRSPEVILDIGWSFSSDLWSLGCILVEIYTGHLLFRTHSHLEHLAMMERIIGKIPQGMLEKAKKTYGQRYLNPRGDGIYWPGEASKSSIDKVRDCKSIPELIKPEHRVFADFIRSILKLDPDLRPTPEEAMQHEFFALVIPEN